MFPPPPPPTDALLQLLVSVCDELEVPMRRRDELRMLLARDPRDWPSCCAGACDPCVDVQVSVLRVVLERWAQVRED